MSIVLNGTNGITAPDLTDTGGDTYQKDNIVGAVSQSGGVPTGAIVETGSNVNGQYVKYADGTMVCWLADYNPTNLGGYYDWSLPTAFVDTTYFYSPTNANGSTIYTVAWPASRKTTTSCRCRYFVARVNMYAIGRWF